MILETYPAETLSFLKEQKNRFDNPIGYTISSGIEGIFDELAGGPDFDKAAPHIDSIVRIMAVQEIVPSKAAAFIMILKRVVRKELEKEIRENRVDVRADGELSALESKIDSLTLLTFDIYMKCREKLYEIRTNETKRLTFRLLQKAKLVCEVPDYPDLLNIENISKLKRGN